jgi:hypothetical protein
LEDNGADKRLEGLRKYKLATNSFEQKYKSLESELGRIVSSPEFGQHSSIVARLFDDFNNFIGSEIRTIAYEEEPIAILGDIHGSDGNFLRLESVVREKDAEINLLREKWIALQKERPTATNVTTDQSRTIQSLRNEINNLSSQLSNLRAQSSVNVNISANTQEYEIKIRTLNSRIQELESQLRTVRIDYEGQIRTTKTDSEKALRDAQLKTTELDRKVTTYEREISNLKSSIADYERRVTELTAIVNNKTGVSQTPIQLATGLTSSGNLGKASNVSGTTINTSTFETSRYTTDPSGYSATRATGVSGTSGVGATSYGTYGTPGATGVSTPTGATGINRVGSITGTTGTTYSSGSLSSSGLTSSGNLGSAVNTSGTYGATGTSATYTAGGAYGTSSGLSSSGLSGSGVRGVGLTGATTGTTYTSSTGSTLPTAATYTPGSYANYRQNKP